MKSYYYFIKESIVHIREGKTPTIFEEFDPGSGLTLAECLTHASRTNLAEGCEVACYGSEQSAD